MATDWPKPGQDEELAKLRERCEFAEQERDQARKELSRLEGVIDQLDAVGSARAKREGKPYDRYTCWAEPAAHLLEDLADAERERDKARAERDQARQARDMNAAFRDNAVMAGIERAKERDQARADLAASQAREKEARAKAIEECAQVVRETGPFGDCETGCHEMYQEAIRALATTSPGEEKTYPCQRCGKSRTKAEGGTTFTVCDKCWDETYPPAQPAKEAERCVDCGGEGHRAYPDTTLGRGGIGGQMISSGVCRACNGTGAAKKEGAK